MIFRWLSQTPISGPLQGWRVVDHGKGGWRGSVQENSMWISNSGNKTLIQLINPLSKIQFQFLKNGECIFGVDLTKRGLLCSSDKRPWYSVYGDWDCQVEKYFVFHFGNKTLTLSCRGSICHFHLVWFLTKLLQKILFGVIVKHNINFLCK